MSSTLQTTDCSLVAIQRFLHRIELAQTHQATWIALQNESLAHATGYLNELCRALAPATSITFTSAPASSAVPSTINNDHVVPPLPQPEQPQRDAATVCGGNGRSGGGGCSTIRDEETDGGRSTSGMMMPPPSSSSAARVGEKVRCSSAPLPAAAARSCSISPMILAAIPKVELLCGLPTDWDDRLSRWVEEGGGGRISDTAAAAARLTTLLTWLCRLESTLMIILTVGGSCCALAKQQQQDDNNNNYSNNYSSRGHTKMPASQEGEEAVRDIAATLQAVGLDRLLRGMGACALLLHELVATIQQQQQPQQGNRAEVFMREALSQWRRQLHKKPSSSFTQPNAPPLRLTMDILAVLADHSSLLTHPTTTASHPHRHPSDEMASSSSFPVSTCVLSHRENGGGRLLHILFPLLCVALQQQEQTEPTKPSGKNKGGDHSDSYRDPCDDNGNRGVLLSVAVQNILFCIAQQYTANPHPLLPPYSIAATTEHAPRYPPPSRSTLNPERLLSLFFAWSHSRDPQRPLQQRERNRGGERDDDDGSEKEDDNRGGEQEVEFLREVLQWWTAAGPSFGALLMRGNGGAVVELVELSVCLAWFEAHP